MVQLLVPQIGQLGNRPKKDCGPACALMVARAYGAAEGMTVEDVYAAFGLIDANQWVSTIAQVLRGLGVPNTRQMGNLPYLREWLDERKPCILLVDYAPVVRAGLYQYAYFGGHFVVVTGYDDEGFTVNDPYWRDQAGKNIKWPNDVMEAAWRPHDQYNYTLLVPNQGLAIDSQPAEEIDMTDYKAALENILAIARDALDEVVDEDAPEMETWQVNSAIGLNLRDEPSTARGKQSIIRTLQDNERVQVVSKDQHPWWQVQAVRDFANGYVDYHWLEGPLP